MDFARFKNFIRQHNDKLILFEQGEPEIVMMSFGEYERLLLRGVENESEESGARAWNDADWPIGTDAPSEVLQENPRAIATPVSSRTPIRLEDVQLEDLPIEGF